MKNKKNNIILLFIKVLLLFIIVDSIIGLIPGTLSSLINYSYYTYGIIAEALAIIIVLIVLRIRKKSYIFYTKKDNFFKTIYTGLPMFILSIIVLITNTVSILKQGINIYNIIALIFYCAAIGMFEELLCRGWLLKELVDTYGKNRKQVIISIFLSSVIFGLMHISNIWVAGQTVFETVLQILNAISLGCFLGAVYYRTKNIFGVAFLHGFYDFSILLGESSYLKECTTGTASTKMALYQSLATLVIIIIFILCTIIILRKTKLNELLQEKEELNPKDYEKDKKLKKYLILAIVLLNFAPLPNVSEEELNNYEICYTYDDISIKDYNILISTYKEYEYNYEYFIEEVVENPEVLVEPESIQYNFKFYLNEDKKVVIENINTRDYIILEYENIINFNVINNNNNLIILIQTYEDGNSILYYNKYITTETLSNSIEYLNNISKTFNSLITPDSVLIGMLNTRDNPIYYPLVITEHGEYLILNDDNKLLIIK